MLMQHKIETQNFSRNFTITGNGAEDTVNVAQAQLGKPVHSLVIQNNGVRILLVIVLYLQINLQPYRHPDIAQH